MQQAISAVPEIRQLIHARTTAEWPARLGKRPRWIRFEYYEYASFENKIWFRKGKLHIRLHTLMRTQPDEMQTSMVRMLLNKLFNEPESLQDLNLYKRCLDTLDLDGWYREKESQRPSHGVGSRKSVTAGTVRDLEASFQRVNKQMFHGDLERPDISWSPVKAQRNLGSYQQISDRLLISRKLDRKRVPLYVLDYVMYHELLHKKHPTRTGPNGRRIIHGREFTWDEKRFPDYRRAVNWMDRRL